MFNMQGVADVSTATGSSYLTNGIHDVIFKGITLDSEDYITITFEGVEGGTHASRIYAPKSSERTSQSWGESPSQAEQFRFKIKQIIDALDPELGKKIEENGAMFASDSFLGFMKLLNKHLESKIGIQTQIKLLPNSKGYGNLPTYVVNINKEGVLYMATKFIGADLVLTPYEIKAIEKAKDAKPTAMANDNDLDALSDDFLTPTSQSSNQADIDDGMPF